MIRRRVEHSSPQAGIDRRTFLFSLGALSGLFVLRSATAERPPTRWSRLPYFPPNAVHILNINDVHYRSGKKERMPYEDALDRLAEIAYNLQGAPIDLVIQGGDLIQEENDPDENYRNYWRALAVFQLFAFPVLNLVGNHCRWALSEQQISQLLQSFGMTYQPFTVVDYSDFQVVTMNPSFPDKPKQPGFLLPEHLEQLTPIIAAKRTILFSHYDPFPQLMGGNRHFSEEEQAAKASLANSQKIKAAWKGLPLEAIFSGHAHWTRYASSADFSSLGLMHRVTLPSLTENMYGGEENPGIYNIISIMEENILVQTYCQDTCLSPLELVRVR